jgi:hypothetical protein
MKYIAFVMSVLCVVILGSCGENEAGGPRIEAVKPVLPALSTPPATNNPSAVPASGNMPAAPIIAANAKLNPAHGQPGHRCDIAVGAALPSEGLVPNLKLPTPVAPVLNTPVQNTTTTPVVQPIAATTVAAGLNPAHGQPGHRCDIPVGQPLNSKPQANKPAATTPTPVVNTSTAPVKSDGNFAKGLNPAHGQPGHRCDIAVGQPLNGVAKKDSSKI